jgi:hypothetical protein
MWQPGWRASGRPVRKGAADFLRTPKTPTGKTPVLQRAQTISNTLLYCGADRTRTDDFLLAKQALYQLSYGPIEFSL